MEKLNQGNKSTSQAPYNEIYESFSQLFLDLLQPRPDSYDSYVRMHETETELLNYINSGMKPVCLFSGLTGIGKTSVLNYVRRNLLSDHKVHCIYINLVGRRAKLDLGEDYCSLDVQAARNRAEKVAETYLIEMLIGSFSKDIALNEWRTPFYNYVMENMSHLIMHLGMHAGDSEQEHARVLNEFRIENPIAHAYASLKFYCNRTQKNHVVILLDNTDQKDFDLIEAFVNILADFNVCIGREVKKVTSIISCRPYNEKRLQKNRYTNSLSSHGDKTIELTKPCGISKIIRNRKEKGGFINNPLYVTTKKGAKWTIDEVDKFLDNLTNRYDEEGLEDLVTEINNYDLSLSFDNTVNILSNRYFLSAERLLPNIIHKKNKKLPFGVSRSAVLKSLAYGNPKNKSAMFYPSDDSKMPIPNLLNWNVDYPETFLSKFRVIQFLVKRKAWVNRNGFPIADMEDSLKSFFKINQVLSIKVLRIMYHENLIFTHSNRQPEPNKSDFIVLSPKGKLLFNMCQYSSLLMEFWFDDTPVDPDMFTGLFLSYKFTDRLSALIKFLSFIWEREKSQLSDIIDVFGLSKDFR